MTAIVVMGVAGCGKSSLGAELARVLGWPLVEGDEHHSAANVAKMRAGTALTDADRAGWLAALGVQLQAHPAGVVLSCSALKRAYRDQLRAARPADLRFAHLQLTPDEAQRRVAGRSGGHYFNPALVASQFATLQPTDGEADVLALDATQPLAQLSAAVQQWLATAPAAQPTQET